MTGLFYFIYRFGTESFRSLSTERMYRAMQQRQFLRSAIYCSTIYSFLDFLAVEARGIFCICGRIFLISNGREIWILFVLFNVLKQNVTLAFSFIYLFLFLFLKHIGFFPSWLRREAKKILISVGYIFPFFFIFDGLVYWHDGSLIVIVLILYTTIHSISYKTKLLKLNY